MADPVTIHDAKTNFSKLVARVEAGEEIIIARGKTPVARLAPLERTPAKHGVARRRGFGALKGTPEIPDGFFFDPLPDDELDLWEGRGEE
jgi:prevent-host-death family protein